MSDAVGKKSFKMVQVYCIVSPVDCLLSSHASPKMKSIKKTKFFELILLS